jgi:hypothetical protein
MSTQITQEAATAAHGTLFQNVYAPAFFQKLAEHPNVPVPRTAEEAEVLLRMAGKLRSAHDTGVVKLAAAENPFLAAEALLDECLQKTAAVSTEQQIAADVARISANPDIAAAALTYQNAIAQEILASRAAA